MGRLDHKTAIITGAAGGMGKAMALLFAREGAQVLATDLQEEKLLQWVEEAKEQGLPVSGKAHDVSSEADWTAVVDHAITSYGKIDILINNAGVYPPGSTTENTTLEQWNRIIAINVTGPFIGTKHVVPHLRARGGGAVVHISSIAGIVGGNGPAYSASKGALRLLAKDQAVEFAADSIRVNSIHPGGVLTPMTEFLTSAPGAEQIVKEMCPMGRIGTADEIAFAALYLASDEAAYTTGAELVVDGGLVAR